MSLLNFEPSGPSQSGSKKPFKLILGIGALVGTIALGSTLAASINLNSGGPVEFGQGVTQTTACDDEITLTPISTFVNEEGGGSHKFSSLKVSGIDSSPGKCDGKTFVIKAYGNSGPALYLFNWESNAYDLETNPDREWQEVDRYNYIEIRKDADEFTWISDGTDDDDVVSDTSDITQSSFTVLLTSLVYDIRRTPLVSAEAIKRITIESKDSVYNVGDTGPGGGTVFYHSPSGFSCGPTLSLTCHSLEAAPSSGTAAWLHDNENLGWTGAANEWNHPAIGADARGTAIGSGYKNTVAMVTQSGGGSNPGFPGTLARAYRGPNGLTDWYLPSTDELTELLLARSSVGGIAEFYYWTSTEFSDTQALMIETFGGPPLRNTKWNSCRSRAIRAF